MWLASFSPRFSSPLLSSALPVLFAPLLSNRLYTEHSYLTDLAAHTIPEIQRSDLTATVLQLKSLGIDNIMRFDWLSPPAPSAMIRALETLFAVRALDMDGRLTKPVGVQLAEFPLDPLIAFMLLVSANAPGTTADGATGTAMKSGGGGGGVGGGKEEDDEEEEDRDGEDADGCSEEMCTVAASLCVQSVWVGSSGRQRESDRLKERFAAAEAGQTHNSVDLTATPTPSSLQRQPLPHCNANPFLTATPTPSSLQRQPLPHCNANPFLTATPTPSSLQRQPLPHCNANPFLTATPTPSSLQRQPLSHCNANPFLTATPTPSSLQRQPLPHCNANPFLTATPTPSSLQRQPLPHCNANPFLTATPTPSSLQRQPLPHCNANPFLCVLQRQPLPLCSATPTPSSVFCAFDALSLLPCLSHQGDFVSYLNVYEGFTRRRLCLLPERGDFVSYLNVYEGFTRSGRSPKWCHANGINYQAMLRVDDVRGRLRRGLRRFSNLPPHPSPPLLAHPHSSLPLPAPTSQLRVDDVRGQLRKGAKAPGAEAAVMQSPPTCPSSSPFPLLAFPPTPTHNPTTPPPTPHHP
ncbi:unnamed protein product [Closterium sp. Naga37s-1]|nr:unnamed protein product [Closterium sp. Naga37s-1]